MKPVIKEINLQIIRQDDGTRSPDFLGSPEEVLDALKSYQGSQDDFVLDISLMAHTESDRTVYSMSRAPLMKIPTYINYLSTIVLVKDA